jgi:peptidoglycan/LPS O-acetylase OafA/YrhL/lysophospholipase L1-like esterase
MPKPVEGTSSYVPGLDGMRAIAVLAVIAFHLNVSWAKGGLLGVGVFFVLSGYLITDLLVAEYRRRQRIALPQFWLRRARRLLPALFVMLFVVTGWVTLFDRAQLPALRSDLLPGIFYYSNWWFIFQHVSYFAAFGPPSPLGHLWSLAIEEQFYLVWPFLLLAGLKWIRNRRALVGIILVAAAASAAAMSMLYTPGTDPTRIYDGTDTRAFGLLIGAALAFLLPRDHVFAPVTRGARRVLDVVGVAALAGIFVMFWRTGEYDPFLYQGGLVLLSVLTALVTAVVVHPGARLGRWLGREPLRWIGERSYGIYLWHYPVIVLTTPLGASPSLLRATLQVSASIGLAALSWRYVEQPVRHGALGRWWQRMRRRQWAWPPRLRPGEWAVTGMAAANAVICVVGLSGLVAVPAVDAAPHVHNVLPPDHSTTTTSTPTTDGSISTGATTTTAPPPAGQGVTAIGDSIMIDAAPYLEQMLPGIVIDAKIGQQLTQVQSTVPALLAAHDIGTRLVIELGTNGPYSVTQLDTLLSSLGPAKKIVLVNTRVPRTWQTEVNSTIAAVVKTHPNATLVNWYADSASDPQYFYTDGVHLNPQGAQYYASLIVQALQAPAPAPPATTTSHPVARTAAAGRRR